MVWFYLGKKNSTCIVRMKWCGLLMFASFEAISLSRNCHSKKRPSRKFFRKYYVHIRPRVRVKPGRWPWLISTGLRKFSAGLRFVSIYNGGCRTREYLERSNSVNILDNVYMHTSACSRGCVHMKKFPLTNQCSMYLKIGTNANVMKAPVWYPMLVRVSLRRCDAYSRVVYASVSYRVVTASRKSPLF